MPSADDPDAAYTAFAEWAEERGTTLYPAQEEAVLEIVTGANVVLSTPTGTGKSLVAIAAHAVATARGEVSYYTAPIKALVSEKFFQLVDVFGAENVGMVTGDTSVNPDAPIICCTAEILANLALRHGEEALVDVVIMDEFHYYADADRGWAWQVPLLTLPRARFVLMSATLGDVTDIADDLEKRTGRPVAKVTGVERPVPLFHSYERSPIHETVEELLHTDKAPVYIVHFSQAAAMERAQALMSIKMLSREARDEIADAIGEFRFTTAFGKSLSRLVRSGIGVHHAGMLPKYRRLVEQLAGRGLLRVICGTDTLGVGINVPIRTVLLTALTKFDGTKMRQLTAREFHQLAGRAGRAGYDTAGYVAVEAPEHEIENARAIEKAGDDPKKKRKIIRKKAPEGFVSWGEASFEKLLAAEPEPLTSRMQMTASMLMSIISRGSDALSDVRDLIFGSHEPRARKYALARRAIEIFRTLVTAEVVEVVHGELAEDGTPLKPIIRLTAPLQHDFALNQPLSPFALAALDLLDPASPEYALDVVSVIEATLDNPRPVLSQQEYKARGEAVGAMKAEGIEYEERMELLEEVTYPKPLEELLTAAYDTFAETQPWIRDYELKPKSVVRDMAERAMTFGEFVSFYALGRSEGLVLRYLGDAYRALRHSVPEELKSEELLDIVEWLGELVRQVDSSLLDEWESLINPAIDPEAPVAPPAPPSVLRNRRAFTVLVRNELFRRVQLMALEDEQGLMELDGPSSFGLAQWGDALDAYYEQHDSIGTGPDARSARMLSIEERPEEGVWHVQQILDDPEGDHDWRIFADVDLTASEEEGVAIVRVTRVAAL
jgi:superfamily II RNA helicase